MFEHQGKYYILDWKSNHLGHSIEDYHPDNLNHAMIDHRYDFQYQIYALALHRFLQSRLANYDYQQHFGGVYYLFLRGFSAEKYEITDAPKDALKEESAPLYGVFSAETKRSFLAAI